MPARRVTNGCKVNISEKTELATKVREIKVSPTAEKAGETAGGSVTS
jgi:hypothetical protein